MGRFLAGFALASVLWLGLVLGVREGLVPDPLARTDSDLSEDADAGPVEVAAAEEDDRPRRRRRRGRRRPRAGAPSATDEDLNRQVAEGDDLDGTEVAREIDVGTEGGEAQLSPGQIDQAMGAAMGRFQRCLVLAAGEAPVRGRLVFDLRVSSDGAVQGVRLEGPASVASGEAGGCLRGAARRVRFPSYDGPPTRARWSLTLE